jgi:hypothetical protein
VTAQTIQERGRIIDIGIETHSIGSLLYKNLKLRKKEKKREVVSLRELLLSSSVVTCQACANTSSMVIFMVIP